MLEISKRTLINTILVPLLILAYIKLYALTNLLAKLQYSLPLRYNNECSEDDIFTITTQIQEIKSWSNNEGLAANWHHSHRQLFTDKVYVINLPHRKDRRRYMNDLFNTLEVDYELVQAVPANSIPSKIPGLSTTANNSTAAMTLPELACLHSHISVLQDIQSKNHSLAAIFEDDVDLDYRIKAWVHKALASIPKKIKWDLLFLGNFHSRAGDYDPTNHTFPELRPAVPIQGTHAYVVNGHKSAQKLLGFLYKAEASLDLELDYLNTYGDITALTLFPPKAIQVRGPENLSDIYPDNHLKPDHYDLGNSSTKNLMDRIKRCYIKFP
ncbi:hypothetical protein H4219_002042 [Mycoemilia scoparia]|uniref:Glycosyl transferase family 25 domain-containing protein n=1 Tax=Mycoemilia scoparia TaxID=417184 RepID=A0A9W8A802_9FUNG|nr:hypothetical protein H4219_002042 [Mycoemilia scoparia]